MVDIQAQAADVNAGATNRVAAVAGGVSSSARALNNRLHWMWAWEQAQQRVQPRPAEGAEIDRRPPSASPVEEISTPPETPGEATAVHAHGANRQMAAAEAAHTTGATPAAQPPAAVAHTTTEPMAVSAVSLFLPLDPGAREGTVLRSSAVWNRWHVPDYEPQLLHVFQSAQGLRVWLRDFRLEPNGGPRILAALRRELARSGIALAALTVNGHLLWEHDAARGAADMDGVVEGINHRY